MRIARRGIGYDVHPFGGDGPLVLGGVDDRRPRARRPLGRRRGRRTRSPTRCWARPGFPISARCSPRPTTSGAACRRSSCCATSRSGCAPRAGGSATSTSSSRPSSPKLGAARRRHGRRTSSPRSQAAAEPMGEGIHVQREAQARRRDRRDRPVRGHRGVGGRAARPRLKRRPKLERRSGPGGSLAPMLRIFDTAARAKVDFVPRRPGQVSMYVCGPTVYDVPHVGHGRTAVVFDVIRRYLAVARRRGHVREQHHRHRGQDHPPRAGTGHDRGASSRTRTSPRTGSSSTGSACCDPTTCRTRPTSSRRCSGSSPSSSTPVART